MGGRNYNQKMMFLGCGNPAMPALRVAPETACANPLCGHPFSEHDTDRTLEFTDEDFGGSGCLSGWTGEIQVCGCAAFTLRRFVTAG